MLVLLRAASRLVRGPVRGTVRTSAANRAPRRLEIQERLRPDIIIITGLLLPRLLRRHSGWAIACTPVCALSRAASPDATTPYGCFARSASLCSRRAAVALRGIRGFCVPQGLTASGCRTRNAHACTSCHHAHLGGANWTAAAESTGGQCQTLTPMEERMMQMDKGR
eukprot:COSAG06_NODE_5845_length_3248_cov_1.774849_3_plen_167_part_00